MSETARVGDDVPDARPGPLARGGPLRTVLFVLLAYAVLGALAGVVWEWVWTPPGQVVVNHQLYYDGYASLRRVFTGTGLYALVAAGASALVALAVTALTRGRELLVLLLVLVGSAIAAAVMLKVGTALGPPNPAPIAAHTSGRAPLSGQLTVEGKALLGVKSPYLVWPLVSLFVLAVVYFALPGSHEPARDARRPTPDHREADPSSASHR